MTTKLHQEKTQPATDLMTVTYAELVDSLKTDLMPLGIDGMPVNNEAPAVGDTLVWSGESWAPSSGGGATWTPLPYNAPFSDWGSPYIGGEYAKDAFGVVSLRGGVKNTASFLFGAAIATLPAGYAPPAAQVFPCVYADGSTVWGTIFVLASADGHISLLSGNSGESFGSANSFIDLSTVRYST